MLEIIQVTNPSEANNFIFFNEWKNCDSKPLWVASGAKVNDITQELHNLQKIGGYSFKKIISQSNNYKSGYKHQSHLLNLKWHQRSLYITQYDPVFYLERKKEICIDEIKANFLSANFENCLSLSSIMVPKIERKDNLKVTLFLSTDHSKKESINFDWIQVKIK